MAESPSDPEPAIDLDASEDDNAGEMDNTVPSGDAYALGRVVGIGGSAGSIQALQSFFSEMQPTSGMAFVVVLHLSPEHKSALSEVLQHSTSMAVVEITDGMEVLPNRVHVIPPAKHVTLEGNRLRLSQASHEHGRRATVDLFFRSLADACGPHAVAIVLSGGDGDGAVGVKRIKERGGLTIAQDPEIAEHSSMPSAAIATSMVDWVLRCEDMPARLLEYQARGRRIQVPPESGPNPAVLPRPSISTDETALREVLTFLRARTGRDFSYYKRATIVRRVARRMQVNEVDTLSAYFNFLRTHPGEASALLQDLLISVTNFFRDKEAFAALEATIPELFKNKSQADTIRVWVPACATGEEAYSVAMLLTEHAAMLDAPPGLQVFATDLDEDVLAEARSGLYPEAIAADVSPDRLRRFFVKEHQGYRVRRELREKLLFAVHDLLKDSPFSRLDLVSCRNLMIYLNRSAQERAFDIFHFALRPEGKLFLGISESVDDSSQLFQPLDKKHRIYVARPSSRASLPVPAGPSTLARALALQERGEPVITLAAKPSEASVQQSFANILSGPDRLSWSELHLKLIDRFGPPSLIVNAEHDILHISESAAQFLQFGGGEPSTNLLRTVHPMLRHELRGALFRARQAGKTVDAPGIPLDLDQKRRLVDVTVSPASELGTDFLLVTFALHASGDVAPAPPAEHDEPALRHLERELEQTKQYLQDIVEQHEASHEELRASNEELQAMNEELRSASEELETSREELQSINEELTTVNQELKSKVDELGHTNSDLHNLMNATAIATVFLDRELRIMRFTPRAVDLFSLIPTDIGRPLADLQRRLIYPELLADARQVLQQLVPIEREVPESAGRFFLARILPYRTTDDRIAGAVLTFVDITERHRAQEIIRLAQQDLELRVSERTSELDQANVALRQEIRAHEKAEGSRRELQKLLILAQEDERRRISRELHDEVGQRISALMLSLRGLESSIEEGDLPARLRELRSTAEGLGREIHQLAFELRPIALDDLGLARALGGYLEGWSARTGIPTDFVSAGIEENRLPAAIETTIYRIVQEATNNVLKHAHASQVSVSVERRGNQAIAIVEDNGSGFDAALMESGPEGMHIGIAGMRERAALVGGDFTLESSAGSGTTVRVRLPV